MEITGQYLKKIRLEKKITLSKVSDALKVPISTLKNIEDGKLFDHVDKAYLIGHVRSYSDYLNLDSNNLVKEFKKNNFNQKKNITDLPKPIKHSSFVFFSKSLSFASIIFISFGFYYLFINSNEFESNNVITPDVSENYIADIEKTLLNIDNDNLEIVDNSLKPIDQKSQSSAVASFVTENEKIEIKNKKEITLKFIFPTWIQIRDQENNVILSKLMNSKEEYTYLLSDNYLLTTGNAGNIVVLINGETRGKVGNKGEVIDSLTIGSNFNN